MTTAELAPTPLPELDRTGGGGAIVAPQAGYTDGPFRKLCYELGAAYAITEMVSAAGVVYGKSDQSERIAKPYPGERPIIQLFGTDPGLMAEAGRMLYERYQPRGFDINMGCPVPKIIKQGAGSALMTNVPLAQRLVQALCQATPAPVSVKFRAGFDSVTAPDFALALQDAGACALAVHGRTQRQSFAGAANWEVILTVRDAVQIPVIGSGDVFTAQDFRCRRALGVGVMIGRGAQGNPWIFREVRGGPPPTLAERLEVVIRHTLDEIEWYGAALAMRLMRAHYSRYFRGFPGALELRDRLVKVESLREFSRILLPLWRQVQTAELPSALATYL
ncbi:MAG: tRNA-dihydrouridine synthase [Deinococcus sp.]|nr:tRNA-dihydrouridine synthase [Deinococcus sp.]